MQSRNVTLAILVLISPVLFALIYQPDSFSLSWNQGRGGWLFATAFVVAELVGIKLAISRKKVILTIPPAAAVIAYLVALNFGLRG